MDPMNGTTAYAYDAMSNLTSLTDAKGQTTSFEYDGYNRVKKVIYPAGRTRSSPTTRAGGSPPGWTGRTSPPPTAAPRAS